MNYDIKQSGERIHQLRKRNGYTQEQLSQALNIDRSYYSRIESGKSGCSVDLFVRLSELFGASLDYLILGKRSLTNTEKAECALLKEDMKALIAHMEQFCAKF
jgi:transcriptional regulator with XRE-family HTH domain